MSPENRVRRWWPNRESWNSFQEEDIVRLVRTAENAALERAAKHIMDIYPNCLAVAESVRSLKSRAPKRKAGRA